MNNFEIFRKIANVITNANLDLEINVKYYYFNFKYVNLSLYLDNLKKNYFKIFIDVRLNNYNIILMINYFDYK